MVYPTVHLSVLQRQHTRADFNRHRVTGGASAPITGSANLAEDEGFEPPRDFSRYLSKVVRLPFRQSSKSTTPRSTPRRSRCLSMLHR